MATRLLPYSWVRSLWRRLDLQVSPAILLTLLFAQAPLAATDLPIRSASKPDVSTAAHVVQILGVFSSSQTEYSRIIIDLSEYARYTVSRVSSPERLYIDFSQTAISPRVMSRTIAINGELIERIRLGTDPGSVTRIVFDLHTPVRYRISQIASSTRMLVELSRATVDPMEPQDRSSLHSADGSPSTGNLSVVPAYAGRAPTVSENAGAEKAGLNYAGAPPPQNVLALGVTTGSGYNDNVLGGNQQRTGDAYFLFGPNISLRRETRRLNLALNYQPNFRIYRRISGLNAIDQDLEFDAAYRVSSRLTLRARTAAFYTNGFSQAGLTQEILAGVVSPSGLNQTLYTPTLRQLMVSSRVDGTYQASARDSIGFFFTQSTLNFEQQISKTGNLQDSIERDAGLLFRHRLTPHTTVGIDYMFQTIEFGPDSRTLVHSGLLSYEKQFSPSLSLRVFGGPQYSQQNGQSLMSPGSSSLQPIASGVQWNWASGGELTKRTDKFVFQLTAQHQVTNGVGVLNAVVGSSVKANVRHQLTRSWDAVGSAGYENNSVPMPAFPREGYRSLMTGIGLQHSVTEKLTLGMRYDFVRQTVTGNSPSLGNFRGDLWCVQLAYRFREIALGR